MAIFNKKKPVPKLSKSFPQNQRPKLDGASQIPLGVDEIKIKDLLKNIEDEIKDAGPSVPGSPVYFEERDYRSSMMQLKAKEYSDIIAMRTNWSRLLMVMLVLIVFLQGALFILVGLDILKFEDEWLARILFPGTFAEVLGFVLIVIRYLFPNRPKEG